MLERLHSNLVYLSTAADLQSNSRFALRENRELISKEDLNDFHARYPFEDSLVSAEDIVGKNHHAGAHVGGSGSTVSLAPGQ